MTTYQQKQRTKAQKIRTYTPSRKSSKFRSGAKPKTTGITQTIGEVIKTNYSVGAPQMIGPVQTGNQNEGGSEKELGFRSIYKNPVYLVLFVVVLGSLLFAFKK